MKKNTGFTLVELLAVVIILSILTAIAVPQYTKAIKRSEASNALIMLKTVFDAAKRFQAEQEYWPSNFNALDTKLLKNQNSEDTSNMFQFSFDPTHQTVTVSRLSVGEGSPYQLVAYYSLPGGIGRDTYTCRYNANVKGSLKFKDLCDSICSSDFSGTECSINKSTFIVPVEENPHLQPLKDELIN